MFKARCINVCYEESQSIEKQGKRSAIDYYIRRGFRIKESRNGYWVLYKPVRVNVTINCGENGVYTYDLKDAIVSHYGREKISYSLVEKFKEDFANGNLEIWADTFRYMIK